MSRVVVVIVVFVVSMTMSVHGWAQSHSRHARDHAAVASVRAACDLVQTTQRQDWEVLSNAYAAIPEAREVNSSYSPIAIAVLVDELQYPASAWRDEDLAAARSRAATACAAMLLRLA